jgi:hypothetical protein
MPTTTAFPNQAKADLLPGAGVHLPSHEFKLALVNGTPTYGPGSTSFSATGEITGTGYTAGGKVVTLTRTLSGSVAFAHWVTQVWAALTASDIQGAILYNNTLAGKPIVGVYNLGGPFSPNGVDFTVESPAAGSTTALVRLA